MTVAAETGCREGAAHLLAAALRGAIEDLELLRSHGRPALEIQLQRMWRRNSGGRTAMTGKWITGGQYLSAQDLIRILDAPEWVRGEQCAGWCRLIGIDHEAFVAEMAGRGLLARSGVETAPGSVVPSRPQ